MKTRTIWAQIWVGSPGALWKRRLILGVLEWALLLVMPLDGITSFGQLLLYYIFSFGHWFSGDFLVNNFDLIAMRWWVVTAVFLPLVLTIESSIGTRRCIARKSPVQSRTKIGAKVGGLIPCINCAVIILLEALYYEYPQSIVRSGLFLRALAIFACSLYHAGITFEGRRFRALDFRGIENPQIPGNLIVTPVERGSRTIDWVAVSKEEGNASRDPRTLWKRRLVISTLECALFLSIPLAVEWGPWSSFNIIGAFYGYSFIDPWVCTHTVYRGSTTCGQSVSMGFFNFLGWIDIWNLWWLVTAIFLPFALGVMSSIATRRSIAMQTPIPSGARIAAKAAAALPLFNCLGLLVYNVLSFIGGGRPCGNCIYFRFSDSLFVAPIVVFACALFQAWITFEGRRFRGSDFRVSH